MKAHKTEYRIVSSLLERDGVFTDNGYDWLEVYNSSSKVKRRLQISPETIVNIKDWDKHILSDVEVRNCDTYPTTPDEID